MICDNRWNMHFTLSVLFVFLFTDLCCLLVLPLNRKNAIFRLMTFRSLFSRKARNRFPICLIECANAEILVQRMLIFVFIID